MEDEKNIVLCDDNTQSESSIEYNSLLLVPPNEPEIISDKVTTISCNERKENEENVEFSTNKQNEQSCNIINIEDDIENNLENNPDFEIHANNEPSNTTKSESNDSEYEIEIEKTQDNKLYNIQPHIKNKLEETKNEVEQQDKMSDTQHKKDAFGRDIPTTIHEQQVNNIDTNIIMEKELDPCIDETICHLRLKGVLQEDIDQNIVSSLRYRSKEEVQKIMEIFRTSPELTIDGVNKSELLKLIIQQHGTEPTSNDHPTLTDFSENTNGNANKRSISCSRSRSKSRSPIKRNLRRRSRSISRSRSRSKEPTNPRSRYIGLVYGKRYLLSAISDRFERIRETNVFSPEGLEDRVLNELKRLPEYIQLSVVSNFCSSNMNTVRSKNGLLMSMIKRAQNEQAQQSKVQLMEKDEVSFNAMSKHISSQLLPESSKSISSNFNDHEILGRPSEGSILDAEEFVPLCEYGYAPPVLSDYYGFFNSNVKQYFNINAREGDPGGYKMKFHEEFISSHNNLSASAAGTNGKISGIQNRKDSSPSRASGRQNQQDYYLAAFRHSQMYSSLPIAYKRRLHKLFTIEHPYMRDCFSDIVLTRLKEIGERQALDVIDRFAKADVKSIKNVNGFIVGIILRNNSMQGFNEYGSTSNSSNTSNDVTEGIIDNDFRDRSNSFNRQPPLLENPPPHLLLRGDLRKANGDGYSPQLTPSSTKFVSNTTGLPPASLLPSRHPSAAISPATIEQWKEQTRGSLPEGAKGWLDVLHPSVVNQLHVMVSEGLLSSIDEFGDKCYEVLNQITPELALEVLHRYSSTDLESVRNKSGFLIGVIKRCRQEFNQ